MSNPESPQQSTSLTVEHAFSIAVDHHKAWRLQEAEYLYRAILSAQPDHADVHRKLGILLMQAGRYTEAEVLARQLAEQSPTRAFGWKLLGTLYTQIGRHGEALQALRHAAELMPSDAEVHNALGVVLRDTNQFNAAMESCLRALELKPQYAEAHNSLGVTLNGLGQFGDAIVSCRRALEIRPGFHQATFNLGVALLALGQYNEGWPCYEMRSLVGDKTNVVVPDLPFPPWRGESLLGKSLLLWTEQGFGDYIQFVRYASLLKDLGVSRLTICCRAPLKDLLKTAVGVDEAISDAEPVPAHDYWSFPLSLPLHFGTTVDTVPADVPYLFADATLTERIARDFGRSADLKIGVCWKGSAAFQSNSERSPGLGFFEPIFGIDGVRIYTLLPNSRAELIGSAGDKAVDLGHEVDEFTAPFQETAALIMNLDLVVTCDTSICHLAGALGKPVWLVLPYAAHWVWMTDREDSPWYPNTRLFRQTERGDWAGVFERVGRKIKAVLAGETPLVWPTK